MDGNFKVWIEEDEHTVRLVQEQPCTIPNCHCKGNSVVKSYNLLEHKKHKPLPKSGSLQERQLKWLLQKIKNPDYDITFPSSD